jgi:2-oxoglutarate ferredoxin oxidoreductase subunit delta
VRRGKFAPESALPDQRHRIPGNHEWKGMVTPMAKMNVIFDRCKGCELCTTACPKQIVAIQHEKRNKEGVFTAYCTDDDACIGCAMCAMMCPDCAIVIES